MARKPLTPLQLAVGAAVSAFSLAVAYDLWRRRMRDSTRETTATAGRDSNQSVFGTEPSDASLQKSADGSSQAPSLRSPSGQTATDWTSDPGSASGENVHPFAATKFFSSIGFEESLLLYEASEKLHVAAGDVIFRQGDDSEAGVFVVMEGSLGVFLQEDEQRTAPPLMTNTLREGESVGDVDVLDGAPRSVSCIALQHGALLARVSRAQFLEFVVERPEVLALYLQQGIARLWRVAHFVLSDFLQFPRLTQTSNALVSSVDAFSPWADSSTRTAQQVFAAVDAANAYWASTTDSALAHSRDSSADACDPQPGSAGTASNAHLPLGTPSSGTPNTEQSTSANANPPACPDLPLLSSAGATSALASRGWLGHYEVWAQAAYKVSMRHGQTLYSDGHGCQCFYLLLSGRLLVDPIPWPAGGGVPTPPLEPGCIVGAAGFFTHTLRRETVRAAESCQLLMFGAEELERLKAADTSSFVALLILAVQSLSPLIRRFITLGLNRVWACAGDTVFERGDPATTLYIIISGRVRIIPAPARKVDPIPSITPGPTSVDAAVQKRLSRLQPQSQGRPGGSTSSKEFLRNKSYAEPMTGSDANPAKCPPWFSGDVASSLSGHHSGTHAAGGPGVYEVRRGDTIGEGALLAETAHDPTAVCVRDTEMVRMSRAAFQFICSKSPSAAARLLEVMARKLRRKDRGGPNRQDMVTIALLPGSGLSVRSVQRVAVQLEEALSTMGQTLRLDANAIALSFADETMENLHTRFYRSKLTSWMSHQEDFYRFILLEADPTGNPLWTRVCVSQADCVLVVANGEASPEPTDVERQLLWQRREGARNELILLHNSNTARGTKRWRELRPYVWRHHHVQKGSDNDLKRVARHLAGQSVGVVLAGGGCRGLAHLGALRALQAAGVPIDVVGGTSQGAFMAAMFAMDGGSHAMLERVRRHAEQSGHFRHLISDITLPLVSIFSGNHQMGLIRESFGDELIEDLWLNFFCTSTNLSSGEVAVHTAGSVAIYVRAAMSVLGLVPPVHDQGNLLVDGGYLNAIPVDVMQEAMGVSTVIVVDAEDKQNHVFKKLMPFDGGISGWKLLWDRLNPFSSAGRTADLPRYHQMVDTLMYATSMRKARDLAKQYMVDLYVRPPSSDGPWHNDYHQMDVIVRAAYRYTMMAVAEWRSRQEADASTAEAHSEKQGGDLWTRKQATKLVRRPPVNNQ